MRTIVTGSIAYDYIMSFPGDFSEHILPDKIDVLSVSFLVDSLRREPGGCAANIAYNLALLGERPAILATVGEDFEPDRLRLEREGVDTSLIKAIPGTATSSFFVSTDQKSRQIASFYIGAMGSASELSFHDIDAGPGDIAIIAPNAPEAMVKYVQECKDLGIPYVYDPSQQIVRLTGEQLSEGIAGSLCFVANEYEYELVHEKTGLSEEDLLGLTEILVVTHGAKGSVIKAAGETHHIPVVPAEAEVDPTGVGDAYRAGILFGLHHNLPWPLAGRLGAVSATYALEALGTQAHGHTLPTFLKRYESAFGPVPDVLSETLRRAAARSKG
jgi:adenosine kinase